MCSSVVVVVLVLVVVVGIVVECDHGGAASRGGGLLFDSGVFQDGGEHVEPSSFVELKMFQMKVDGKKGRVAGHCVIMKDTDKVVVHLSMRLEANASGDDLIGGGGHPMRVQNMNFSEFFQSDTFGRTRRADNDVDFSTVSIGHAVEAGEYGGTIVVVAQDREGAIRHDGTTRMYDVAVTIQPFEILGESVHATFGDEIGVHEKGSLPIGHGL